MKRYVREEGNLIYDRLRRKHIEIRTQKLIGERLYINDGSEDEVVVSRDAIDEGGG